jgi:hypothetical protein
MMRTTPFYPRLRELNQSHMWGNWAGYLSATKYDLSSEHECSGCAMPPASSTPRP